MKLKESCSNCQRRDSICEQSQCQDCGGRGWILTHEGEVICEFLKDHMKIIIDTDSESGHKTLGDIEFD